MPIPDFQTLMLPLLEQHQDGKERSNRETVEALAAEFSLTDEEQRRPLPSGTQPLFYNRVAWARSYLKQAGLLESPRRGLYRITDQGRQVLTDRPSRVDITFLRQFPSFQEFRTSKRDSPEQAIGSTPGEDEMTPEEHIALGYEQIRTELVTELLGKIKECPPEFFEQLVIDLLLAMGYGGSRHDAGQAVGRSGDGGIDGIIKEDRLGLDVIYVQAKRWEAVVGRPEIQKFAGALQGLRARKGIFITTSGFSKDARDYVSTIDTKIILLGGEDLANLMIDHGIGVNEVASYVIKRVDSDYFTQE